jgi:hypothetical protein
MASCLTPYQAVQDAVLALPQLIRNNNRSEFLQFHGILSPKPSKKKLATGVSETTYFWPVRTQF